MTSARQLYLIRTQAARLVVVLGRAKLVYSLTESQNDIGFDLDICVTHFLHAYYNISVHFSVRTSRRSLREPILAPIGTKRLEMHLQSAA
jgi:hypothetical protein